MTPASEQVLRKLLEGVKTMIETALSLMAKDEPENPAPEKPRYLGDNDGDQGQEHQQR